MISDECYESLIYEGRHVSIASLSPEIKARTIVVNACSKAYAMTGWRIGYAAGPRAIIRAMTDMQSQVTSNPASIAQWAAVEALTGPQDEVAKMVGEFDRRRRLIVEGLNAIPGVSLRDAQGRVLRVPQRVRALRQARARAACSRGRPTCARFLLDEARIAGVAGGRLRLRCAHPPVVRDERSTRSREGLARMDAAVRTLAG